MPVIAQERFVRVPNLTSWLIDFISELGVVVTGIMQCLLHEVRIKLI